MKTVSHAGDDLIKDSLQPRTGSFTRRGIQSWYPVLIVLAGLMAYANSFRGEFILDDFVAIQENPSIRHLWPLTGVLFPAHDLVAEGNTIEGRPLLNLSFALNFFLGGLKVWGYHAVNLAIHLTAGLLLLGVARRTFSLPRFQRWMGRSGDRLAFLVALIWVVHPLQTESVAYIAQRAESLVGMFYLLTLYLAIRAHNESHATWWRIGSVAACVLGMGVKEVMVTAPIMVIIYDGIFVANSWGECWKKGKHFYLALILLGWGTLGMLLIGTSGSNWHNIQALLKQVRGHEDAVWAGHDVHWTEYARMQVWAVIHYLRLSFWPSPLVFSYGRDVAQDSWKMASLAIALGFMIVITLAACRRRSWVGFVGAWFFLILAPTSSVVPLSGQLVAEHRMYLPLAGVIGLTILGSVVLGRRLFERSKAENHIPVFFSRAIPLLSLVAVFLLMGLTIARNFEYRTNVSIWSDTTRKWPTNAAAHNNLGLALLKAGRTNEAIESLNRALALRPDFSRAFNHLGVALIRKEQIDEAIANYRKALDLDPDFAEAHTNLGSALMQKGQLKEAILHLQRAAGLTPNIPVTRNNLGQALLNSRRVDEAIVQLRWAVKLSEAYPDAHNNLGTALLQSGDVDGAIMEHEKAVSINPTFAEAWNNLGNDFAQKHQFDDAVRHFERAIEIKPDFAEAHYDLGTTLFRAGKLDEAISHLQRAVDLDPSLAEAHNNLALGLSQKGKLREAAAHFEETLRIKPKKLSALRNLAWLLATGDDDSVRDGARAMNLAQQAIGLSTESQPDLLHVLAAAYAETGRFAEADETAERALALSLAQDDAILVNLIRKTRNAYQAGRPFRDRNASSTDSPATP